MPALSPPAEFPFIPNARPHSIDDRLLDQLAQVAEDLRVGNATAAEGEWLMSTCGPLLRELQTRRAVMHKAGLPLDGHNVVVIGAR